MANYAEISANIERAFGIPWRVGDVVAGEVTVRDRGRSLIEPANNNSTLSATLHRLGSGEWNDAGTSVSISSTSTDGLLEFSFEPDTEDTYRVVFTLDGDYKAKTEITVRVHDPVDRESAGDGSTWNEPL